MERRAYLWIGSGLGRLQNPFKGPKQGFAGVETRVLLEIGSQGFAGAGSSVLRAVVVVVAVVAVVIYI